MSQYIRKMIPIASESIGASGRRYLFSKLIQERPHSGRVWLATSDNKEFVLKDVPEQLFSGFSEDIWPGLPKSPFIRLPFDTIPPDKTLVYKYLEDDFLHLVTKQIPMKIRKQILKGSLRGIADLHDQDIVHLDVKPDNIVVNCHEVDHEIKASQIQIIDLENAAYLPKGRCIKGMLAGNENWRSPEAHFRGELNKPADIFSFGIVCIYAMLGQVIFGPDEDFQTHEAHGALPHLIRLQRQISYFGDLEALNGLMKHVGDEEINCQVLRMLWEDRNEEHIPYKPFSSWPGVDASFNDLIKLMTNLDPLRRGTAREILEHPWFSDVEENSQWWHPQLDQQ